ncbi:hypothetical protein MA03_04440 [Infirmifilum uzonense]|uniref:HTH arsR-type domain-containing protein n=2 Tax=Thermofilaceae TaxID=114378 RepID=A0A0F7FHL9_9CREN|nr:hypothetical protein MA03_04440 [Infirmifilum uzonense]
MELVVLMNMQLTFLMEILSILSTTFAPLNLPRSSALILALLYAVRRPLNCSEIQSMTGYSKSAVSAALKVLESHRLVHKVKSGRRNHYSPSLTLPRLVAESHLMMLRSARDRIRELSRRFPQHGDSLSLLDSEISSVISTFEASLHGVGGTGED